MEDIPDVFRHSYCAKKKKELRSQSASSARDFFDDDNFFHVKKDVGILWKWIELTKLELLH